MNKKLMLGNEAVARGLYEAGCAFVSSYPGTPSTEITEYAAEYDDLYAEWAPNEKVALEAALGACIVGARAFAGMKHVGLNVAADPLFTSAYTGVNGGLIVAVADDMGMHSSQDEQDSRHYAIAAKVPMLEPADSQECIDYVKYAYKISEEYDTPVLLRLSTRISHSQSMVEIVDREQVALRPYAKDPRKYVMMPANARVRHVFVEERLKKLAVESGLPALCKRVDGSRDIGIIASGTSYQYAREALGQKASYLKLGMVHPIPMDEIRAFAQTVKKLYIIEELDPIFEQAIKAEGIAVAGGKELFSLCGEYTAEAIREKLLGEKIEFLAPLENIPVRPPVLCPGCPHRGTFYVLSKLRLFVSGDIGCYTLGALPPLSALDTTIDMGASISGLHGMNIARGTEFSQKSVAVIGDSTFLHSGITGLLNIVYNQSPSTVLILDNSITGMTGHQQNPSTGLTLKNKPAPAVDIAALCRAIGVKRVRECDPFDLVNFEAALKEELLAAEPSVMILKRPCALLKSVKAGPPYKVDPAACKKCRMCMKIGCPAISFNKETGSSIDVSLCVGCGLCAKMCKFGAISL